MTDKEADEGMCLLIEGLLKEHPEAELKPLASDSKEGLEMKLKNSSGETMVLRIERPRREVSRFSQ